MTGAEFVFILLVVLMSGLCLGIAIGRIWGDHSAKTQDIQSQPEFVSQEPTEVSVTPIYPVDPNRAVGTHRKVN